MLKADDTLTETGTVVTMALDIPMKRVTTYMVFSKGEFSALV